MLFSLVWAVLTPTVEEHDRLRLGYSSYRTQFLHVNLIIRQISYRTGNIVTSHVEEISVIRGLIALAIGRDRVSGDTGTVSFSKIASSSSKNECGRQQARDAWRQTHCTNI